MSRDLYTSETLMQLFVQGPTWDGNLVSKGKRSGLPHGVSVRVNKGINRYFAQIQVGGKNHHLGTFDTPEDAAAAYIKAAQDNGFHENHAILRALQAQSAPLDEHGPLDPRRRG